MWYCDECDLKGTPKCKECQEDYAQIEFETQSLFENFEEEMCEIIKGE